MLTAKVARELLRYEPETGGLFWKRRAVKWFKTYRRRSGRSDAVIVTFTAKRQCESWNRRLAGKRAGYLSEGYWVLQLFGRQQAARVIFLMQKGRWPEYIDHIDRDGTNNRWSNLREATSELNSRNRSLPSNNTTGIIGVHWDAQYKTYRAKINVSYRRISLGRFAKLEDAIAARKVAEARYGFTEGHGSRKR